MTSCFLMAMFAVHSCCTYQCWHMPDPIPCMNIGPCFSIHQLVSFTFWPYEQCSHERLCTDFFFFLYRLLYEHVFSSLGYPSMPRHKTGRWHMVIYVKLLETRQFFKAAVCCTFPSHLRMRRFCLHCHQHFRVLSLLSVVILVVWKRISQGAYWPLFVSIRSLHCSSLALNSWGSPPASASWLLELQLWATMPKLLLAIVISFL